MKRISAIVILAAAIILAASCSHHAMKTEKVRPLADTIGFAHLGWQMDSIMARIMRQGISSSTNSPGVYPKAVICPHDDYSYVGSLYPEVLSGIKAKTVILFGVAHKARLLGIENQVVFDSYDYWAGPYGKVKVSGLRELIQRELSPDLFQVNDSLQRIEHSVEAIIPFLQYYNRDLRIVSILVPYMPYEKMQEIAKPLAQAINKATIEKNKEWGRDFAIVISTDAVHYGDEDWGGKNYAPYGTDSAGYAQALAHEREIVELLTGKLVPEKISSFWNYTVSDQDYHDYKWTWCGRYSVPLGLLTAWQLGKISGQDPLVGEAVGYSNSIDHAAIDVTDLGMGLTAPANIHHWVGYAGISYK